MGTEIRGGWAWLCGQVYVLNAWTGQELWTFKTSSEVQSSPAVVSGILVEGNRTNKVRSLSLIVTPPRLQMHVLRVSETVP